MTQRTWRTVLVGVATSLGTCLLLVAGGSTAQAEVSTRVTGTSTIATGLTSPWGLAFLPDGTALVSERDTALVKRIRPGAAKAVRTVGRIPGVTPYGEGGHNGGRLVFGPDGMLYASTGDTTNSALSQDLGSLGGKVLRMTPTGKRPRGNPFPDSLVWTFGHRNVQGLAFGPGGRLFATEFGQQTVDELNVLRPGRNYGWPIHEGASGDPGFVDPIAQWSPTSTASPSGVAIAGSSAYVATLAGQRLFRVPLTGAGARTPIAMRLGDLGRLRTVSRAPDGSLWLMTSNTDGRGQPRSQDDRILRLTLG